MNNFRMELNVRHEKIIDMLRNSEECSNSFKKFFFSELFQLYGETIDIYENRISNLERRILELEKELIFTNLPPEQCR
jgi:hypothetical protein